MVGISQYLPSGLWTRTNHSPVVDESSRWKTMAKAGAVVVKNLVVSAGAGAAYGAVRRGMDLAMASVQTADVAKGLSYGVVGLSSLTAVPVGYLAGVNFAKKYGCIDANATYSDRGAVVAGIVGAGVYVGANLATLTAVLPLLSTLNDGPSLGNRMSELPGPLVANLVASIASKFVQGIFEPVGPRLATRTAPPQGQNLDLEAQQPAAEGQDDRESSYPSSSWANLLWNEPIKLARCLSDNAPRASLLGIGALTNGWQVVGSHAGVGAAAGMIDGVIDLAVRPLTDEDYTDVKKEFAYDTKAWAEKNTWIQFGAAVFGALSQAAIAPALASVIDVQGPHLRPLMYAIANCTTHFVFVERFKDELPKWFARGDNAAAPPAPPEPPEPPAPPAPPEPPAPPDQPPALVRQRKARAA